MDIAVDQMAPGVKWSKIAAMMEEAAKDAGFSVVREYVGHGIGTEMHEDPKVPNFVSKELLKADEILLQGMALAIMVPMVLLGAFRYWQNEAVDIHLTAVSWIVVGALAGVMIGTMIAGRLPVGVLRKIFAVVLVVVAVKMFMGPSKSQKAMAAENMKDQNNVSVVEPGGMINESEK